MQCCNGEHPGDCIKCAGWGDAPDARTSSGFRWCSYCGGTGACPKCNGKKKVGLENRDVTFPLSEFGLCSCGFLVPPL
jgi:hypothetical protein